MTPDALAPEAAGPRLRWLARFQVIGRLGWGVADQAVSSISNFALGLFVARMLGARIARDASMHGGPYLSDPRNLRMGQGSGYLDLAGPIDIGDNVTVEHGVTFVTTVHGGLTTQGEPDSVRPITLLDRAWIGTNVTIMPGVTIGRDAIVGAGALVIKDVPDNHEVAGVPARFLRLITSAAGGAGPEAERLVH